MNDEFTKQIKNTMRNIRIGSVIFGIVFLIQTLLGLAIVGGLIWIIWHFLSKIW